MANRTASLIALAVGIIYYSSNPKPQSYYDYTFRVAGQILVGKAGFSEPRPSWLNEFVPFEGFYYSVFPLGAVISMLPAALLKNFGLISESPGSVIASIHAAVICFLLLKIASHYDVSVNGQVLLTLTILFGTFMWTNLTFAGAWQLALGFAMIGQLGAIYFTVFDRRPLLAGLFFALAFGNRTENLLTAPIFFYLMVRDEFAFGTFADYESGCAGKAPGAETFLAFSRPAWGRLVLFCLVPFILGTATLWYNYARFHSFTDFGYARIPGVLQEPWYDHGIFSTYYISRQAWEMLFKMWNVRSTFPFLVPDGFSSSIMFSSPFLLLVFRFGSRDRWLKYASWAAVFVLTFLLWIHGNSGGWQFGYRYAMILLPWVFVIMLESMPKKVSLGEWLLFVISILMNLYATWLFHWTEYVKP
ncbi:MAG: hypothetical protein K1X36_04740 [Pyrinomonadaceae bacterium]|nr:hypothetical protein [Pyrinomonadaceae bacterium]